jgi:hypothetical protein
MGKHTPGPWSCRIDPDHAVIVQRGHSGGFVVSDLDIERAVADACLIAAAPDLLAAVVQLEVLASRLVGPEAAICYYELTEARAAIAKATAPIDSTKEAA